MKGSPPDEPCERCQATGVIEPRPLEELAGDLKRELAGLEAAELKSANHQRQLDEATDEAQAHRAGIAELQRELINNLTPKDGAP